MSLERKYTKLKNIVTSCISNKSKPKLSEGAKTVRRRIFYVTPIAFLILISNPTDGIITFLGFNIEYKQALVGIFITLVYLVVHFAYELIIDTQREKGNMTSIGLLSEYLSRQTHLAQQLSGAVDGIDNALKNRSEYERDHDIFLRDFIDQYKTSIESWFNEIRSARECNPQNAPDFGVFFKSAEHDLSNKLNEVLSELEKVKNKINMPEIFYNNLETELNKSKSEIIEFQDFKSKYICTDILLSFFHIIVFYFYYLKEWLFEVWLPFLVLVILIWATLINAPDIEKNINELIKQELYYQD